MKKIKPISKRWGLTLSLMLFIFLVIAVAMLTIGTIIFILFRSGRLSFGPDQFPEQEHGRGFPGGRFVIGLLELLAFSGLLSFPLSWFFGRQALNPMRKVIDAISRIAAGDFSVRVELRGVGELRELSQSFNKMAQELTSIETMRSDFVNSISHEFKTPIASIEGFAELLQAGNLSHEEQQECLSYIILESKRLAALSTNILALSKYENTEIIADKSVFPVDEQIRRVVVLTEPKWSAKGLEIHMDMEEDIRFEGNQDLTYDIWLNLLDNAIKFSPQGGKISIRLARHNRGIRFSIQDSGIGMDEQAQARCFDKFYQADASKAKAGNGLGLSIVQRVVELHGGTVEVKSKPGQGCCFVITL